jgi:hypothetical protein
MDAAVRPVILGSDVYFASKSGSFTRLREYFVNGQTLSTEAADVTAHVQRYVPSGIFKLAGSDVEDAIFAVSGATGYKNRVYSYKRFWSGDEKIQSAWSYWEVGATDIILSLDAIEDTLYMLVKRSDGTFLEKAELDINAASLALDFDILLDSRYDVQGGDMSYSAGNDETTITLPYETEVDADMRVILTSGAGDVGVLKDPALYTFPLATKIVVPGDITSSAPVVGVAYEAMYEFSEQFVQDRQGNADTTGRLQLRTFAVTYQDSGYFSTKVWPYGSDFAADTEVVIPAALDAFTGRTLGEANLITGEPAYHTGSYQFYIDGTSKDVKIQLLNDSHLQSIFTSVEWEGYYTKRSRSV